MVRCETLRKKGIFLLRSYCSTNVLIVKDEENSLSIIIDRIYASMAEEEMNHDRYLAASRAISLTFGRIESIHRTRRAIYENLTDNEERLWKISSHPGELFVSLCGGRLNRPHAIPLT